MNTGDNLYNAEQFISSNFVRYATLNGLVNDAFKNSNSSALNIFIDLNSVFKSLYRDDVIPTDSMELLISSSIINMCGHYRRFFTNMGVATRIFLIFGDNCPKWSKELFPRYNEKYINDTISKKNITDVIVKAMKYINMLVDYIPGVYFFDIGRAEVSSMIVKIIEDLGIYHNGREEIMVISKDICQLQLIPKYKALKILRPLKYRGEDNSFIVTIGNLWKRCFENYTNSTTTSYIGVPEEFLTNILAMTRVPDRSFYKIMSTTNALQYISKCLEIGTLKPRILYMQSTINTALRSTPINEKYNPVEVDNRWSVINPFFQYKYILPLEYSGDIVLKDLDDVVTLKEIALRYYDKRYPLMLDNLY